MSRSRRSPDGLAVSGQDPLGSNLNARSKVEQSPNDTAVGRSGPSRRSTYGPMGLTLVRSLAPGGTPESCPGAKPRVQIMRVSQTLVATRGRRPSPTPARAIQVVDLFGVVG